MGELTLAGARVGAELRHHHPPYRMICARRFTTDASELKALLALFPSEEMTCWPVSARVGNVKNNDPSLIEPIAA